MPQNKQKRFDGLTVRDFDQVEHEQRQEQRFSVRKTIGIQLFERSKEKVSVEVEVFDCSRHGIGLIYRDPIAVGERFLAKFQVDRILLAVYTTRFCREIEDNFQIGAQLTEIVGMRDGDSGRLFDELMESSDGKRNRG